MSVRTYKVAVPGILLKNGKFAKYGTEITGDQIDQPETRHDEGYIKFKKDFDKEAGIEEKEEEKKSEVEKPKDEEGEEDIEKEKDQAKSDKPSGNAPVKKVI